MARNRNDSGSSNHAQMRMNFTDSYRKNIGKQDGKKNTKSMKELIRKNEMKALQAHVSRDLFIVIMVLLVLFSLFYIIFHVLYGELGDVIFHMTAVKD